MIYFVPLVLNTPNKLLIDLAIDYRLTVFLVETLLYTFIVIPHIPSVLLPCETSDDSGSKRLPHNPHT